MMIGARRSSSGKKVEAKESEAGEPRALVAPLGRPRRHRIACYVWATTRDPGTALAWLHNPGPHGFSEMLYEFTSAAANNGSGFEGLGDNTPFWNISTGIVMLLSRYIPIFAPLALAASSAPSRGTGDQRIAPGRQRGLSASRCGPSSSSGFADVPAGRGARPIAEHLHCASYGDHHGQELKARPAVHPRRHGPDSRLSPRDVGRRRVAFRSQAEGSLIRRADGTIVGSRLIAEKFVNAGVLPATPVGGRLQRRGDRRKQRRSVESGHLKAVRERLDDVIATEGRARQGAVGDGDGQRERHGSAHSPEAAALQAERVATARGVP
jgi:hypothetical protein